MTLFPFSQDPRLLVYRLSNGLTCRLLPVQGSDTGSLELKLMIRCGFLQEREGEYGVAHLLEHLALCGSRHFPNNSLLPFLESLGMRVGRDINAWTGPTETTFALSFSDALENGEDIGFRVLSDIAFGLMLSPEQMEREKKVVLEEMRLKQMALSSREHKMLEIMFPHKPEFRRNPLGDPDTLLKIDRERVQSFYESYYRPEHALLFAVGRLDPDLSKKLIAAYFGKWQRRSRSTSLSHPIPVTGPKSTQVFIQPDDALTESRIDLFSSHRMPPIKRARDFRNRLIGELALKILGMRLEANTRGPNSILHSAHAGAKDVHHTITQLYVTTRCSASNMRESLTLVYRELIRFCAFGPSQGELETAERNLLLEAQQHNARVTGKHIKFMIQEMIRAALTDSVFPSPARSLALTESLLPGISATELRDFAKSAFAPGKRAILLSMPSPSMAESIHQPEEVKKLLHTIEVTPENPFGQTMDRALGYPIGDRGNVMDRAEDADLNILSVTFENGVRLHIRSMDELRNQVVIRILLQGGRINENPSERGLTDAAALPFYQPATSTNNSRELCHYLQNNQITISTRLLEDGVQVSIQTPSNRLESGCRLAHALLTEPHIEKQVLDRWRDRVIRNLALKPDDMDNALRDLFRRKISGGDPRFAPLTREHMAAINREKVRAWLMHLIRHAPMEMSIAGHEKRSTALELAKQYFATLNSRPRRDPDLENKRRLQPMMGPLVQTLNISGQSSTARIFMGWRAPPWDAVRERRMFHLAAQMLNTRLKRTLRQEQGRIYDLYCAMHTSKAYPTIAWIGTSFSTAPEQAEDAAGEARRVMEAFSADGPEENELKMAKDRMTDQVLITQKKTAYWSHILSELDYHHGELKHIKNVYEGYRSLTNEDISRALERYFARLNRWQFICRVFHARGHS